MSEENRRRTIRVYVHLTQEEYDFLEQKLQRLGIINREAYFRKMLFDGYILKLDIPELKEMISLLRYTSNNINQIAKRVNESGRIYETDITEILEKQTQIWELANKILLKLSKL